MKYIVAKKREKNFLIIIIYSDHRFFEYDFELEENLLNNYFKNPN